MNLTRREFFGKSALLGLGLSILPHTLQALDSTLKIGYLPITDHLLILSTSLPDAKVRFMPIKFSSWADLAQSFSVGAVDGAFLLAPLAFKLHSSKINIKALMAGHRNGSALVVGDKSGIDSMQRLKGAKIAIPSRFSIHYILLCELLNNHNIPLKDVRFIDMPPPEMLSSLQRNSIDAFIVAEPFAYQAESMKIGRTLILTKDIRLNHICCIFCVGKKLYGNKELVQNLVDTFVLGQRFIVNDAHKVAKLSKQFLGQKVDLIESLLTLPGRVSYEHLEIKTNELELLAKNAKDLSLGSFDVNGFLDSSFIQSALKA